MGFFHILLSAPPGLDSESHESNSGVEGDSDITNHTACKYYIIYHYHSIKYLCFLLYTPANSILYITFQLQIMQQPRRRVYIITTPQHTPLSLANHCLLTPSLTHHRVMSSSPTVDYIHHHHHTSITRVLDASVHHHLHHHHSSLTLTTTLLMHQSELLLHPLPIPTVIRFRHATSPQNPYLAQVNIYSHIQSHICDLLNLLFSNRLFSFTSGQHPRRTFISIFNSYR